MTQTEADHLRRQIRNLVAAEVDDSWSGGGDPDDTPAIAARLRKHRKAVNDLIRSHTAVEIATPPTAGKSKKP